MELVIDANIFFSALISSGGKTQELLFSEELILFAPEFLGEELRKHEPEISKKSGLSKNDFELAVSLISSRVYFVPFSEFKQFLTKAKKISPDPNDVEYFAVALKHACALWSNDKELKKQDEVKVVSTTELLKLF